MVISFHDRSNNDVLQQFHSTLFTVLPAYGVTLLYIKVQSEMSIAEIAFSNIKRPLASTREKTSEIDLQGGVVITWNVLHEIDKMIYKRTRYMFLDKLISQIAKH